MVKRNIDRVGKPLLYETKQMLPSYYGGEDLTTLFKIVIGLKNLKNEVIDEAINKYSHESYL